MYHLAFILSQILNMPSKFGEHPSTQFYLHKKRLIVCIGIYIVTLYLQPGERAALDNLGQAAEPFSKEVPVTSNIIALV